MPREAFGAAHRFLPRAEILTFEEIERVARVCFRLGLGVRKLRLTGGEPLLRHDLPGLVRRLAATGVADLALTTNGSLLAAQAAALAAAGLGRVSVSLDSLDDTVFRAMNDVRFPVARVLEGIAAAEAAGLVPLKINAVVPAAASTRSRSCRWSSASAARGTWSGSSSTSTWVDQRLEPRRRRAGAGILERIAARHPLEPIEPGYRGEVARRWRLADGSGEIGVVASVTAPFCGDCTRARLSADGHLYTCLFATAGRDLRPLLRSAAGDDELAALIGGAWGEREDRYSELRAGGRRRAGRVEMSYIGG